MSQPTGFFAVASVVRRSLPGFTLALLVTLTGCKSDPEARAADPPEAGVSIGRENIAIAERRELKTGPAISGSLAAEREAKVRAEIAAAVTEVLVDQGQRVSRGTLLAKLDDSAIRDSYVSSQSAVRTSQSTLELAQRNNERVSQLAQVGAVAERDVEQAAWNVTNAEAQLADAKARLATAQKQLERTEIRAPFTGIVSERQVSAGDVVQSGNALFTIVDPSSLRLEAAVPAEKLSTLRIGTAVDFGVSGYEGKVFTGRIERINPSVDPATRQVRIVVAIPNGGQTLLAGLFAQGRVATETKTAIAVPFSAVDLRGTTPVVFRLRASRVERVPVELGLRDEIAEQLEIKSGIAAGDTLLLGSAQGLSEGTRVRLTVE
jgi:RND family efflux transporter MFP subunit